MAPMGHMQLKMRRRSVGVPAETAVSVIVPGRSENVPPFPNSVSSEQNEKRSTTGDLTEGGPEESDGHNEGSEDSRGRGHRSGNLQRVSSDSLQEHRAQAEHNGSNANHAQENGNQQGDRSNTDEDSVPHSPLLRYLQPPFSGMEAADMGAMDERIVFGNPGSIIEHEDDADSVPMPVAPPNSPVSDVSR